MDCASSVLRGDVDETITEAELIQAGRELGLYRDDGRNIDTQSTVESTIFNAARYQ